MKRLDVRPFVRSSLGLLGCALLVGCHAEAPPTAGPHAEAAQARPAIDQEADRTVEKAEKVADATAPQPAPAPAPASSDTVPPLTAPVVDAVKTQVHEALGELGDGVQQATAGARQKADKIASGARQKADGLEQNLRQASDDLGKKARDATHNVTSDLLKKAQGTVDQGLERARETAKDLVPPPNPAPTPAPTR